MGTDTLMCFFPRNRYSSISLVILMGILRGSIAMSESNLTSIGVIILVLYAAQFWLEVT